MMGHAAAALHVATMSSVGCHATPHMGVVYPKRGSPSSPKRTTLPVLASHTFLSTTNKR